MDNFITHTDIYQEASQDYSPTRKSGAGALYDIQLKLRFPGRELLQMENEGGPPISCQVNRKIVAHFHIRQRAEKLFIIARERRGSTQIQAGTRNEAAKIIVPSGSIYSAGARRIGCG